jgi:hypothetical protein
MLICSFVHFNFYVNIYSLLSYLHWCPKYQKKIFVLLVNIWSLFSLAWESSLKLANNLSAGFVVKQNAQLLFLGKCTLVSVKYASPKKSIIKKNSFKCVSFKTFSWQHDNNILKLWYYIHFPKMAILDPFLLWLDLRLQFLTNPSRSEIPDLMCLAPPFEHDWYQARNPLIDHKRHWEPMVKQKNQSTITLDSPST